MACSVYKLTNSITGKSYIGVSRNPAARFKEHYYSPDLVGKTIRKHGGASFSLKIMVIGTKDYCYSLEPLLIAAYQTRVPDGYNIAPGGMRGPDLTGRKHKQETRERISKSHQGKTKNFSLEGRQKLRNNIKLASASRTKESFNKMVQTKKKNNRPLPPVSEETRKKLSIIHKGQIPWNKGKKISEETRQKLIASSPKKRKPHSEETKLRIGEKSKGRYFSPEVRKKMSESRKAYLSKKRAEK